MASDNPESEDLIAHGATRGWWDAPTIRRALGDAPATPRRLQELGFLTPARLESLPSTMRPPPPEAVEAARDLSRVVGKYVKIREIGHGGFGAVWLAWDQPLSRSVALKFLKIQDAEDLLRFRREASLAAGLSHPNIAAVYEVSEDPPFIAMQFVEGRGTERLEPTVQEALRVVRTAAEAVQYAHEQGIIHRDLKPENIMVDVRGRVYVMDFGLAKRTDRDSGVSRSGLIAGTPAYMSPEQASGHIHLDARTDVYSLGATLYALLTGRPPFSGPPIDVLRRVGVEDPPAPPVDPDLRTIIARAMEKEPSRRYRSAQEFGDDLGRFLAGEPIVARPSSRWYRMRKRVRKNPWVYGVGAVGVAGVLLAVSILVPLWRAERRSAIAQMRDLAGTSLMAAIEMRRAGNPAGMEKFFPSLEQACRQALEKAPGSAEPHCELGRMYRAMMRFDDALAEQEEALRLQSDFGPALYERAILTARKYRDRLHELDAERGGGPRLRDAALESADSKLRQWRESVLADLQHLRGAEGVLPGREACAQGMQQMYEGRWSEAERSLKAALAQDGSLEEAYETLAEGALAQGKAGEAAEWSGKGIEADAGYVPHFLHRAGARIAEGQDLSAEPSSREGACTKAIADLDRALVLAPKSVEAFVSRARARVVLARIVSARGEDSSAHEAAAVQDFESALRIDPRCMTALLSRASARVEWGDEAAGRTRDPSELYAGAIRDYDEVLRTLPASTEALTGRARARARWGRCIALRRGDPKEMYALALRDFDAAIRANPAMVEALTGQAGLWVEWGRFKRNSNSDPAGFFAEAVRDFGRAASLDPAVAEAHQAEWEEARRGLRSEPR